MKQPFRKKTLCLVVSSVLMGTGSASVAFAEDATPAAPAAAPAPADSGSLGAIVVTASSQKKSVLESSLSVTDVSSQLVEDLAPTSVAETLRLIPGIIPSQGSPGGNANIAVRGLPVPTGGGTFVQIQEDGLPTVLFGDMQFGNNDYWTKFDRSETLQAVRGGSASTLASQAPGAVVNYISDTGLNKGGFVALSAGLNFDEQKAEFGVGGPIADGWRFHADGYLKQGRGLQDQDQIAEKGYQLKANVTHDLDDGKGYVRFNLKLLDDREPYQNAAPVAVSSNGTTITNVSNLPGYSTGSYTNIGPALGSFRVASLGSGSLSTQAADGIHPVAQAFGAELHYLPGGGWTVDDKFRFTSMSGDFSTYFTSINSASSLAPAGGSFIYNNGAAVAGNTLINNKIQVYTNIKDAGSTANDLSISNKFGVLGKRDLAVTGGLFYMSQNYNAEWHPNGIYATVGPNGVPVNPIQGSTALAVNGVSCYNCGWGDGTAKAYDITAVDTAPYLNLSWDIGSLSIDGGLRHDQIKETGTYANGTANSTAPNAATTGTETINGTTYSYAIPVTTLDPSTYQPLDTSFGYNSWSLGALYLLSDNTSVFGRASRGGRATFDRINFSNVNAITGGYQGQQSDLVSTVLQQEIGIKNQGEFADGLYGKYSVEFTIFHDEFGAASSDLTKCGDPNNRNTCGQTSDAQFSAKGAEFDVNYTLGGFRLIGQFTYSNASIGQATTSYPNFPTVSSNAGIQPNGVPSLTYMLSPSYRNGPYYGALVITGANATPINQGNYDFWLPPYTLVSAVGTYAFDSKTSFELHVNNLFNSIALTGIDSTGVGNYNTTGTVAYGRTVTGTVVYRF